MGISIRYGAFALAMLGGVGFVAANELQTASRGTVASEARDDVTGSLGDNRAPAVYSLTLSDEQRFHIFEGVMALADTPEAAVADADSMTALPGSIALQDLPEKVTVEVPEVIGYKFVKLDDRIWVVSPASRAVVVQIPRYRLTLD